MGLDTTAAPVAAPARSHPYPLGVHLNGAPAQVAVLAPRAQSVWVRVLDDTGSRSVAVTRLPHCLHGVWFGVVPELRPGARYVLHVSDTAGPGDLEGDVRALLDPYARAVLPAPAGAGPDTAAGTPPAPGTFQCQVVAEDYDWGDDRRPRHPWRDTVVYEAHVRGLTMTAPGVPEELRGSYAGLASPAVLDHLTGLGVTAVELLPVHASVSEPFLATRGLTNYWGYNTLGYFAPEPRYASPAARAAGGRAVLDEFRGMVRALHRAGLEVILDVVYNHTAEGGADGPTYSWRGIDEELYYRHGAGGTDYVDVTGCGNTLDLSRPDVVRMVLDSLRYWVEECHVDGFRFDLAVALGRDRRVRFTADHPFFVALHADPLLGRVKLVAEPWDLGTGGWQTGQFPVEWTEWNDRFRDAARTFWLSDVRALTEAAAAGTDPVPAAGHRLGELATRLAGSADLFQHDHRTPSASVNFVAVHDGFTLADLASYDTKHNEANGEGNRDGSSDSRSYNFGAEGPTDDPGVLSRRGRAIRNLLGTLLVAAGTPMLQAGDEFGRTQSGNNNAYCQDGPLSWVDWDLGEAGRRLLATTTYLTALRRRFAVLRSEVFPGPTGAVDVLWFTERGTAMTRADWQSRATRTVQALFREPARAGERPGSPATAGIAYGEHEWEDWAEEDHSPLLVVVHGGLEDTTVLAPRPLGTGRFELLWDSARDLPPDRTGASAPWVVPAGGRIEVAATSMRLYRAVQNL